VLYVLLREGGLQQFTLKANKILLSTQKRTSTVFTFIFYCNCLIKILIIHKIPWNLMVVTSILLYTNFNYTYKMA